jgi:hypothetical protein
MFEAVPTIGFAHTIHSTWCSTSLPASSYHTFQLARYVSSNSSDDNDKRGLTILTRMTFPVTTRCLLQTHAAALSTQNIHVPSPDLSGTDILCALRKL